MSIDFEELSNDEKIKTCLTQFIEAVDRIEEVFKLSDDPEYYEKLSNKQKIEFNHLMSFSLNGLFWMYMKAQGIDTSNHPIKSENERLKQSMIRAKQIFDKQKMPKLNKDAAQRFVRNSLWVPVQGADNSNNQSVNQTEENWDG